MISYEYFKSHWKRYAWSSFVTFLTGFLVTVSPLLDGSIEAGSIVGILLAGLRAGVKALIEITLAFFSQE